MTVLTLDQLFAIAEAAPVMDRAEAMLRASNHEDEAKSLMKLQQDTGVQIDREMTGYDETEPAPGPESARLNAAYQAVTTDRLAILFHIQEILPAGAEKQGIGDLLTILKAGPPPDITQKPPSPAPD